MAVSLSASPNVNAPFGLRPVRHFTGGVIRANATSYSVDTTNSGIIGTGDLVTRTSTSQIVGRGAASDTKFLGVFGGVEFTRASGEVVFAKLWNGAITSGRNIRAFVYDDPWVTFAVQNDSDTNNPAITDYGASGDVIVADASTVTGQSNMMLDTSDITTGANLKIQGLNAAAGNAEAQSFAVYDVLINEHENRGTLNTV